MSKPTSVVALALLAVTAALPSRAADVFPAERLEPAADKEGIANVEWAGVPDEWGWDAALWVGYEKNPLFTYEGGTNTLARKDILVADRFTADAVLSIALLNWIQIGLDVPYMISQGGGNNSGFGDIDVAPKVRLLRQADGMPLDIALLVPFTLPTGQFTDYAGEKGFTFTPGIAVSHEFGGRVRVAGNLSHRFRDVVTVPGLALGDEVIYRAGISYLFDIAKDHQTEVGLALSGAAATDNIFRGAPLTFSNSAAESSAPGRNPMELLLDLQTHLFGPVDAFVGGGWGIVAGFGAPDFRAYAGIRLSDRPQFDYDGDGFVGDKDKCPRNAENFNGWEDDDGCPDVGDDDHDGIPNDKDQCKDVPEDKDGVEDTDGCPEDDDKDGVPDDEDQCRKVPGVADNHGCPDDDKDRDGIVDRLDKCPTEPEDKDNFEDDDGCPDVDNDKDGLKDADDQCPNEAGPKANHGCPDKDRDSDGVADRLDNCPDEPGPAENGGCAKKQLVVITEAKLEIKDKVYFDTDKDTIQAKSFPLLDNVAAVLKAHPEIKKIRVEGHTDNVGSADHNKDLSDRRAKSVRKYLIDKGGVEAARLDAVGYGMDRPVADNGTDEGKANNRRVEFVIVEHEGEAPPATPAPTTPAPPAP